MNSESKLLLGLGIGVALGAAIGYIVGSDRKEEWLEQANEFADKVIPGTVGAICLLLALYAIYKGKSEVEDIKEDIDDIADIAKKELAKQ